MSNITTSYPCFKCKTEIGATVKKPKYHTPTVHTFNCPVCASKFLVTLKKPKNGSQNQVNMTTMSAALSS